MFPGHSLKNSYIFEKLIGSGGMGEVWSAKRTALGDRVAIKVLKLNSFQDKEIIREQLKKEAKITSILNHPNICKVFDFIEQDDTCFLVMELLEGVDLQALLSNPQLINGIDREKLALHVTKQVLRALDSAHNINHPTIARILHRDIKPSNIFLTKHGEVKLLDLGVAKIETDLDNTKTSNSFYSLHYTSPDLWENGIYNVGKYSAQNDIYSLGLVFYELISGEKAFSGEGKELYEQLEKGIIPSIDNLSLSPETERILRKWTNKSSKERFQNVKDLLTEIENQSRKIHVSEEVVLDVFRNVNNPILGIDQTEISKAVRKNKSFKSKIAYKFGIFIPIVALTSILFFQFSNKKDKIANQVLSDHKIEITSNPENNIFQDIYLDEKGVGFIFSTKKIQIGQAEDELKDFHGLSCAKEINSYVNCTLLSKTAYGQGDSFFLNLTFQNKKISQMSLGLYGEKNLKIIEKVSTFNKFKRKNIPTSQAEFFPTKDEYISITYPLKSFAQFTVMKNPFKDMESIEDARLTTPKVLNDSVEAVKINLPSQSKSITHFHFGILSPKIKNISFKLGSESVSEIMNHLECSNVDQSEKVNCYGLSAVELKKATDFSISVIMIKGEVVEINFLFMDKDMLNLFLTTLEKAVKDGRFVSELNYAYNKSWSSLNERIQINWTPSDVDTFSTGYLLKLKKI